MMHARRLFGLAVVVTLSGLLAACWPMGAGHMGPGGMMGRGRGMMGPGMRRPEPVEGMGPSAPPPAVTPAPTATPGGTATISYRQDIQPIFNRYCVSCHGGQAGLYLDSYDHVMAGSARGRVIVPGDPQASELVRRIRGLSQPRMPMGGAPLPPSDIDAIVTWIAEGTPNN
ncbi:MAG: c-type cytochrome domain-containing protein [Anaerolineae bacterium]